MDEDDKVCYLLLQAADLELVVAALNNDEDQMKLFFGCKALANILAVANAATVSRIIDKYGGRISKRLVHILNYEHMEDLMTEALKTTHLLIKAGNIRFNRELIGVGLVPALSKYMNCKDIQVKLSFAIINFLLTSPLCDEVCQQIFQAHDPLKMKEIRQIPSLERVGTSILRASSILDLKINPQRLCTYIYILKAYIKKSLRRSLSLDA